MTRMQACRHLNRNIYIYIDIYIHRERERHTYNDIILLLLLLLFYHDAHADMHTLMTRMQTCIHLTRRHPLIPQQSSKDSMCSRW